MIIDYPLQTQIDALRKLWREAFRDEEAFLDIFYTSGFNYDRCRCLTIDGQVAAALYWFDCTLNGRPVAYLYGVATAKEHRDKGLCRSLLENTHTHLKYLGYDGVILVPGEEKLFRMYEKMGYKTCSGITEFNSTAADHPAMLREIDGEEYCRLRREYLPENSVIQEGDCIAFLQDLARFYAGDDFLLTVSREENFVPEILGNTLATQAIVAALGKNKMRFRTPGTERPFAMYYPLQNLPSPDYFGLAFD